MDHLSKFDLNQMVNEPKNGVLRKVRELEKMVAPSPESKAWRLAVQTQRRAVTVPQKYEKQHFS